MKKVVIFGMGSLAHIASLYFSRSETCEVAAFTVHRQYLDTDSFLGLPVVPFEDLGTTYPPGQVELFIAVGYKKLNRARSDIYRHCKERGYQFATHVSSNATVVGELNIGENCLVMANTVIQPGAVIGNDVIIWSGNIGYNTRVADHCYVAPCATVAGYVQVGEYCFLGANSTIRDGITIAPECVVGAGAVITKDTQRGEVYAGQQARLSSFSSHEHRQFC